MEDLTQILKPIIHIFTIPCRVSGRVQSKKPVEKAHEAGLEFYGVTTSSDCYKGLSGSAPPQPIMHPSRYNPPGGQVRCFSFNIKVAPLLAPHANNPVPYKA